MTWLITLAIVVAAAFVLFWITQKVVVLPGRSLRSKFRAAGVLKGRTKTDIIATVGPAQSVSNFADGSSLLQWQATGYHICLGFDESSICSGVQSEYVDRDVGTG
jgi:hypothetical protein